MRFKFLSHFVLLKIVKGFHVFPAATARVAVMTLILFSLAATSLAQQDAYPADGAVMLPAKLEKSALADLVVAGEFDRAIAEADRQMKGRATGELLYLRGMAQLGLAEQSREAGAYMDAGLDFMRVVVYFPSSAQAGPAMVEVGYVHTRLGLGDKAREIYAEAEQMIKVEDHPRYLARLKKLAGG